MRTDPYLAKGADVTRKLFHSGNSTVISLPGEMLRALDLKEGDEVTLEVDVEQGRIVIMPAKRPVPSFQLNFLETVDQVKSVS
jgi:antitoxin component of MazEF toxin-antitoxin module